MEILISLEVLLLVIYKIVNKFINFLKIILLNYLNLFISKNCLIKIVKLKRKKREKREKKKKFLNK